MAAELVKLQEANAIAAKEDRVNFDEMIRQAVLLNGNVATFSLATDEDKVRLFNAMNSADSLADYQDTPISVVDFVFTEPSTKYDEGGEGIATIIIDETGAAHYSMSTGIYQSAKELIKTFGAPSTWTSPKVVIVSERQTNNGQSYKFLKM
jgi:hypothetical protein